MGGFEKREVRGGSANGSGSALSAGAGSLGGKEKAREREGDGETKSRCLSVLWLIMRADIRGLFSCGIE